jgi:hypothetical protein
MQSLVMIIRAMNGVHDMGGMDGFGPIPIEQNEPVFHAEWEARMNAILHGYRYGYLCGTEAAASLNDLCATNEPSV